MSVIGKRQLRCWAALIGSAVILAGSTSPAGASVTIGRLDPAPSVSCAGTTIDLIEPNVTTGTGYVVPSIPGATALMISSWSHNGAPASGTLTAVGPLTLKVFRKVADPATYQVVSHDTRALIPATLNTFQASIPVQTGDVLGTNTAQPATSACTFGDPGETYQNFVGNLADGESGAFTPGATNRSLNVSAVIDPSNIFTLGAITRNKKKGTAVVTVTVPNPGELAVSGTGIRPTSVAATGPGDVSLTIKALGKKKRKLVKAGKVTVNPVITYTPTGGDSSTQSVTVKLKKNL
ncbi:MAG: hypothetical protein QOD14_1640 [Solirubrobacterales bacterium]|nr:hypothetical protein [Solirubrobacterales bacterium]